MPAFQFQALDTTGRDQRGVLEGDSPRQVRQRLRERGLTPVVVDVVDGAPAPGRPVSRARGLGPAELALVTRQLATLVRAGVPVEEALAGVAEQADRPRVKSVLMGVRAQVMEGLPLADGLAAYPNVFPDYYRATVAAGEQSGRLDAVLERVADYTETRQQLRQKTLTALIYPVLVAVVAAAVVVALLAYVVPQVVGVFDGIGQELPWITRALIGLADFVAAYGLPLIAVLAAAVGGATVIARRPGPRRRLHRLALRLPLVGRLVRGHNAGRFARTFGILTASGVPAVEALTTAARALNNIPMREAVETAAARVREGAGLARSLAATGCLPPMTVQLIANGEATGRLDAMLERAAANQEREVDAVTARLLGVFEPLLILVMGAVVLAVVVAILLPIFELNQLVQ